MVLLVATIAAFALFFVQNYLNVRNVLTEFTSDSAPERWMYTAIFAVFMYGSLAYQVSRLSFFWNLRKRTRAARSAFRRFLSRREADKPRVEILVPCFQEESHVIWQTLMSAALVDYPGRGVVLLLDNLPMPANVRDRELLLSSRAQVEVVRDLLGPVAERFANAAAKFDRIDADRASLRAAAAEAARLYDEAADFLERVAARAAAGEYGGPDDHTRKFFIDNILLKPAADHRRHAVKLRARNPRRESLGADFARLAAMFDVRLSLFERKRYVNLSHAPNKAANLNSYLSIMGRRLAAVSGPKGLELVDRKEGEPSSGAAELLEPADAEYVIILDADSFLLPEYATCMVSSLESPENARAAVAQTPYTTIPNSPHPVERTAGATTDIYYYVTEGMGFLNAGFWVGASATVRKAALIEVAHTVEERGYKLNAYIQDRTVIEDTGATIDLLRRNWTVHNYPARLSYSATPADFGALVVQRRRWANGGLILLPDLLRHIVANGVALRRPLEAVLRIHYLLMPALISISMMMMLIYPFDFKRVSFWIYMTIPPYLFLVCRDLANTGYRRAELVPAYAMFLLLLPVVLSGVMNSIRQILSGVRAPFARTPKIEQRTTIPFTCIAVILGLFTWSALISYADIGRGDGVRAGFAIINTLVLAYGITYLIGLGAIRDDISWAISNFVGGAYQRVRYAFGGAAPERPQPVATFQLMAPTPDLPMQLSMRQPRDANTIRLQRDIGRMIRKRAASRATAATRRGQRPN